MSLRMLLPCLVLLLSACSSGDSEVNVRGIWEVKVTYEDEDEKTRSVRLNFSLDQDGEEVFGSFAGTDGSGGTIDGVISDRTLDLVLTQTAPCEGELVLLATLGDEQNDGEFKKFAGTLLGEACDGELNAAVVADRREE